MGTTKDHFADLNLEPQPEEEINLDHIVIIGRTFNEYSAIFNLDEKSPPRGKVLNAAGGVSSFTVEACERGWNVLSADPVYCFEAGELERKCEKDMEYTLQNAEKTMSHMCNWGHPFVNLDDVRTTRRNAYTLFLKDFAINRWRYIDAKFPFTPFIKTDNFEMSLVSYLLFFYDKYIDYETHTKILKELLRMTTGEVRIYPITNMIFKESPFVGRLIADAAFSDVSFEIRKTEYEFIKGSNKMLVMRKKSPRGKSPGYFINLNPA